MFQQTISVIRQFVSFFLRATHFLIKLNRINRISLAFNNQDPTNQFQYLKTIDIRMPLRNETS